MLDKRIAHKLELLGLMVDNFNKRAAWQVEDKFIQILARDALDIAVYAFGLDELLQLKYRMDKEKEVGDGKME